jgi:predicted 3-demethylubiquinone-9 3-methyltransferase (glyoxalase superfamily)
MPATTICLWFDDQAEEAARFYTEIFPRSRITGITHYPEGLPQPAGSVMTVTYELDGTSYLGLNGGPSRTFNEAISLQVACADQAEVDHYWSRLTDGGQEGQCGWLTDRFGLSWQIVPTRVQQLLADPASASRVAEAMMPMRKLEIAPLEAAAGLSPAGPRSS